MIVHKVTRMWTVAAIRCAECTLAWEQPMYADDGSTWVCPHCLCAAPAERAKPLGPLR